MSAKRYFRLAQEVARETVTEIPRRSFLIGAVAIRSDGVIVISKNGAVQLHGDRPVFIANAHAEGRVLRKAGKNALLYVSRVTRSGKIAMARPCTRCQVLIRSHETVRVYYTINDMYFGSWNPDADHDEIYKYTP